MNFVAKKATQRFENAFGQNPFNQQEQKKEGEVTIEPTHKEPKTHSKKVGEYIDFEEVE